MHVRCLRWELSDATLNTKIETCLACFQLSSLDGKVLAADTDSQRSRLSESLSARATINDLRKHCRVVFLGTPRKSELRNKRSRVSQRTPKTKAQQQARLEALSIHRLFLTKAILEGFTAWEPTGESRSNATHFQLYVGCGLTSDLTKMPSNLHFRRRIHQRGRQ